MSKDKKSSLEWTRGLLDALGVRVEQTGQSSDYSNRIEGSRSKLEVRALDLATPEINLQPINQKDSQHFRKLVGGKAVQHTTFAEKETAKAASTKSTTAQIG